MNRPKQNFLNESQNNIQNLGPNSNVISHPSNSTEGQITYQFNSNFFSSLDIDTYK